MVLEVTVLADTLAGILVILFFLIRYQSRSRRGSSIYRADLAKQPNAAGQTVDYVIAASIHASQSDDAKYAEYRRCGCPEHHRLYLAPVPPQNNYVPIRLSPETTARRFAPLHDPFPTGYRSSAEKETGSARRGSNTAGRDGSNAHGLGLAKGDRTSVGLFAWNKLDERGGFFARSSAEGSAMNPDMGSKPDQSEESDVTYNCPCGSDVIETGGGKLEFRGGQGTLMYCPIFSGSENAMPSA